MSATIRNCVICGEVMPCTRASRILCSNACSCKFRRLKDKLSLSRAELVHRLINEATNEEE